MSNSVRRIYCANCRFHLYNYHGVFGGKFDPQNFTPAGPRVPPPAARQPIVCISCGQAPYMVTDRGSFYFLTDDGIKPRPPVGKRKVFTYPEEYVFKAYGNAAENTASDYVE